MIGKFGRGPTVGYRVVPDLSNPKLCMKSRKSRFFMVFRDQRAPNAPETLSEATGVPKRCILMNLIPSCPLNSVWAPRINDFSIFVEISLGIHKGKPQQTLSVWSKLCPFLLLEIPASRSRKPSRKSKIACNVFQQYTWTGPSPNMKPNGPLAAEIIDLACDQRIFAKIAPKSSTNGRVIRESLCKPI